MEIEIIMKCKCQDTTGTPCGQQMTRQENNQDGMCSFCADNVWAEMQAPIDEYEWHHSQNRNRD
jgi:hypothetical protein